MFPGMMRGPEPLADHVATEQFWSSFRRFAVIVASTVLMASVVRRAERQALDQITSAF
jgi:hypothetical protein